MLIETTESQVARRCEQCSGANETPRSRWCSRRCKDMAKWLRRGVDCSICGKRMMGGPGTLRDGNARCHPCRRLNPAPKNPPATWPRPAECARCGHTFNARTPDNRWCSPRCRMSRDCAHCGAEFVVTTSGTQYRRTRCDSCTRVARRKHWPSTKVWINPCPRCEVVFVSRSAKVRTCSSACAEIRPKRKSYYQPKPRVWVETACEQCSVPFSTARPRKYCTQVCSKRAAKVARLARMGKFKLTVAGRERIYERDGFDCHLCGHPVADVPDPHPWAPTLDHVVPRAQGGSDDPENLRTAHRWCNSVRGVAALPTKLYPLPPLTWDSELFLTIREIA